MAFPSAAKLYIFHSRSSSVWISFGCGLANTHTHTERDFCFFAFYKQIYFANDRKPKKWKEIALSMCTTHSTVAAVCYECIWFWVLESIRRVTLLQYWVFFFFFFGVIIRNWTVARLPQHISYWDIWIRNSSRRRESFFIWKKKIRFYNAIFMFIQSTTLPMISKKCNFFSSSLSLGWILNLSSRSFVFIIIILEHVFFFFRSLLLDDISL